MLRCHHWSNTQQKKWKNKMQFEHNEVYKKDISVCLNLDVQSPIQTNYGENKMIRRRYTNDHR